MHRNLNEAGILVCYFEYMLYRLNTFPDFDILLFLFHEGYVFKVFQTIWPMFSEYSIFT